MKYTKEFQEYIKIQCESFGITILFFSENKFVIIPTDNLQSKIDIFCKSVSYLEYEGLLNYFKQDLNKSICAFRDKYENQINIYRIPDFISLYGMPTKKYSSDYLYKYVNYIDSVLDAKTNKRLKPFLNTFYNLLQDWQNIFGFDFDKDGIAIGEDFVFDLFDVNLKGKTLAEVIKYFLIPDTFLLNLEDGHISDDLDAVFMIIYDILGIEGTETNLANFIFITNEANYQILLSIFDKVDILINEDGLLKCRAKIKNKTNISEFGLRLLTKYNNYLKTK